MLRRLKLRIGLAHIEFLNAFLGDAMREGFKLGLLFPELRICAALRKKLRVRLRQGKNLNRFSLQACIHKQVLLVEMSLLSLLTMMMTIVFL